MSNLNAIKTYIEDIFRISRFAVLATEADGQPHASLIAVTPMEGFRKLIFATYRNTRKYNNLVHNGEVAVLVESIDMNRSGLHKSFVLTAFGHVEEIDNLEKNMVFNAHLERHPELLDFLQSEECTLVRIKVHTYQVVRGIDDVEWWTIDDLNESNK
ncbi:MAG: pyridoxamine 5'-phosphate oxidase family protein [Bacteroidales bacterium]|nr:pyridoxamine 5'-phosphate oxidase family protein [Bacteroidales bacterium]